MLKSRSKDFFSFDNNISRMRYSFQNNINARLGKTSKLRKAQQLTQADLAISANVGVRFLVDLENGKKTAQIGKVIDVCNALGIVIGMTSYIEEVLGVDIE